MGQFLFCMSFFLASGLASAQGAPPGSRGNQPPSDRDAQRREEIREVLKTGRTGGVSVPPMTVPPPTVPQGSGGAVLLVSPQSYQLTPQARAELREQLRRERYEHGRGRP